MVLDPDGTPPSRRQVTRRPRESYQRMGTYNAEGQPGIVVGEFGERPALASAGVQDLAGAVVAGPEARTENLIQQQAAGACKFYGPSELAGMIRPFWAGGWVTSYLCPGGGRAWI